MILFDALVIFNTPEVIDAIVDKAKKHPPFIGAYFIGDRPEIPKCFLKYLGVWYYLGLENRTNQL